MFFLFSFFHVCGVFYPLFVWLFVPNRNPIAPQKAALSMNKINDVKYLSKTRAKKKKISAQVFRWR